MMATRIKTHLCSAVITGLIMFYSGHVLADDKGAAPAKEHIKSSCKIVKGLSAQYKPNPSITHKPSKSVTHGMEMSAFELPEKVTIPISLDVLQYMNIEAPNGMNGESNITNIDVYMDGRVIYNGRDITNSLAAICDDAEGHKAKTKDEKEEK